MTNLQTIIAALAVYTFAIGAFGYWIRGIERASEAAGNIHSGPEDVERRARRVQ